MSVKTFDIHENKDQVLSVTQAAAEHFSKQVERSGKYGIRFSLKQAGCTGYKYIVEEIDERPEGDLELGLENGVKMFIDSRYLSAIQGTQVDVKQQGLNFNLIMENPNVQDECGCGESFSIVPDEEQH
jgi:Fe-S cluster assembly protein SufA